MYVQKYVGNDKMCTTNSVTGEGADSANESFDSKSSVQNDDGSGHFSDLD